MSAKVLFICLENKNLIHVSKILNNYKNTFDKYSVFLMHNAVFKDYLEEHLDTKNIITHSSNIDSLLDKLKTSSLDLYKRSVTLDIYLKDLTKYYFDLIINLDQNFSLSSVIASYLNTKNIWGAYYDEYGFTCFDNNKYKYLVHAKSKNNLFFYSELLSVSLNIDLDKIKPKENYNFFDNLKKINHNTLNTKDFLIASSNKNIIKNENYKKLENFYDLTKLSTIHSSINSLDNIDNIDDIDLSKYAKIIKNYKFCITDNSFIANYNILNNVSTIFISNEYKNFYEVYPYENKNIIYLLSDDIFVVFNFFKNLDFKNFDFSNIDLLKSYLLNNNNKNDWNCISDCSCNTFKYYKAVFDKSNLAYIVPIAKDILTKDIFEFLVLKTVWKLLIQKESLVGDDKKFISLGEKYIDRLVDINVEVDFLKESIFSFFKAESVNNILKEQELNIEKIQAFKKLAFDGNLIAKSYLHTVSQSSYEFNIIINSNKKLIEHDKKILDYNFDNFVIKDLILYFNNERNNYHLRNLFPMVKDIIFTYETLYTKVSFYEEILKSIIKGVKND
jgi:hypothetical protein